jgi:hypothetical protein
MKFIYIKEMSAKLQWLSNSTLNILDSANSTFAGFGLNNNNEHISSYNLHFPGNETGVNSFEAGSIQGSPDGYLLVKGYLSINAYDSKSEGFNKRIEIGYEGSSGISKILIDKNDSSSTYPHGGNITLISSKAIELCESEGTAGSEKFLFQSFQPTSDSSMKHFSLVLPKYWNGDTLTSNSSGIALFDRDEILPVDNSKRYEPLLKMTIPSSFAVLQAISSAQDILPYEFIRNENVFAIRYYNDYATSGKTKYIDWTLTFDVNGPTANFDVSHAQ